MSNDDLGDKPIFTEKARAFFLVRYDANPVEHAGGIGKGGKNQGNTRWLPRDTFPREQPDDGLNR